MVSGNTSIEARGVGFAYGAHTVLSDVDLCLEKGSMTLLAGRNGAGKSTLLGLLCGLVAPAQGSITLSGQPLPELSVPARARMVTLIPQDADTSFEYRGFEVVMMGRHPHIGRFGSPGPGDVAAVEAALAQTDAVSFADRSVQTLSGGELRRIHIARALATQAPILLADEPTANLDLEHAVAVLDLLRDLADRGHTVLVSSHDLNLIAPVCDAVALLHERRIAALGAPEEVLTEAEIARVFGVRSLAPSGYFPRAFRSWGEG